MLVVRIQGGLGNQIFQYLFALKLKQRFPETEVAIDLNSYRRYHPHNGYELDKWFQLSPDVREIRDRDFRRITGTLPYVGPLGDTAGLPWLVRKGLGLINRCIEKVNTAKKDRSHIIAQKYTDCYPELDLDTLDPSRDLYFDGTWFNESADTVAIYASGFSIVPVEDTAVKALLSGMDPQRSVSVHVRHGDYSAWGYELLSDDYYKKAIEYMKSQVNDPFFYFFSDDPAYVKENLLPLCGDRGIMVEGNEGPRSFLDLYLISRCKNHVVANSSFSYSARVLSGSDGHLVAPKKWINGNRTWDIPGCVYMDP